ncbi:SDR family NAD(P)-dependent oxidoreductase [Streptomyces sp. NPDC050433]|uniref:SDR family NAD(P)-dependent oxidoreductase n=1 Tax=Streptomyces sp. NPDC050433 TaxID=3365615 RepID=UPI0037A72284
MPENRSPQRSHDLLRPLAGRRAATTVGPDDPAVRDHLVHQVPVLPGVFLLDLVLRTVRRGGIDPGLVELRRIVFHAPVMGSRGRNAVEVGIGEAAEGQPLPVTVRSRPADDPQAPWETNCTAELHRADDRPARHIDFAALVDTAPRRVSVDDLYGLVRGLDIDHRGFMRASGTVHVGSHHAVARMRLADEAVAHLGDFHAHPAVLDFATLVPMLLLDGHGSDGPRPAYIPLYIESFRARTGVAADNVIHVPGPVGGGLDSELFDADLEICSPSGEVVAELTGFRAKRVRSAGLITDRARPSADRPRGAADSTPSAAAGGEGDFEDRVGALVARRLGVGVADVDRDLGFYECGLSSVDLLGIAADLEEILGVELYPTLLFEHPTVRRLAGHVRQEHPVATASAQPAPTPVTPPTPAFIAPAAAPVRRTEPSHDDGPRAEPLAVVGLAGRYPGARTPQELWEVLAEGKDRATAVPPDRWDHTAYFDPRRGTPGRTYSRWGAFCEGAADFDAPFFHFDDRQAELTDPHERLLLQTAWEAIEDAGHTPEGLAEQTGRAVGVFAGAMWNDYQLHGLDQLRAGTADIAGSWSSALSNRLSYVFDFAGPSLTVDTACSAGTAALHLAADAIRRGECRAALVGGVNLSLHPYKYLRLAELGLLSPTGRCRPFGRDADGYVPGEGVGVLLVRPLGDALASGDHVYGLVRGSALLHSGRTGGYSVPSPEAQARVVTAALADAGVSPRTIGYLEAHASGTPLGDQIEVEALTSVYRSASDDRGYCAIGSAKPVIGHLEAAAGIAGITKVLMALRHRTLPAAADVGDPHPSIRWETTPFRLPARAEPWAAPVDPADGSTLPRRAAVSAFGAGGANAHVIVEEFTAPDVPRPAGGRPLAVPLSARTESALRKQAGRLAAHLRLRPDLELADVAHTLRTGRRAMAHRLAAVAATTAELADGLRAFAEGRRPGCPVHTGTVADGSDAGPARPGDEDDTARRWAAGSRTEWSVPDGARRVSLPTYPFEGRRHWLGDTDQPDPAAAPDGVRTLLYVASTTPLPLPDRAAAPDGPLLVFDTDPERTRALRALHEDVVVVRPGMSYQRTAPDTFEIEPGDMKQYARLVTTLRAEGRDPAAVLHLWALSAGDTTGSTGTGGVLCALFLCRALMTGVRRPLPVVYAYASQGTSPGHAAVGGLARSVRLEQPKLLLRAVRFASGEADAETLWAEVCAPADERGTEVRHTDDGRFAEVFRPAGQFAGDGEPGPVLGRPGGVYLITGGAGGIGLHTARRIAATDGVSIALLGRSPADHRTERAVSELRALGADAVYLTADVTDRPALLTAVEQVRQRFGPLTGVVHAAGVLDDALLVNKTRASAERVLAPKTEGIAALDAVTGGDPLDYLLMHSSLASAVGSLGGADYSAANRALDAFASWREEQRLAGARHGATVALDWPLWRDGGMRIDPALQDRVLARTGSVPLDTGTALDTLDAALVLGAERVVVLHGDPARLTAALDTVPQALDCAPDEPSAAPTRFPGPSALPDQRVRAEAAVEAMVTAALRRAGTEPPPDWTRTGFMALGLTSVQLAGLTTELGTWLGAELPATTLLRYPDTDRLVGHLLDDHATAVSAVTTSSAGPVPDGPPADGNREQGGGSGPDGIPVGPSAPSAVVPRVAPVPRPGAGMARGEQPIAVIGMAGRFPGSRDTAGFWADLLAGRDLVGPVPAERWDHSLFHDPEGRRVDATDCGHGGFLDDVTRFDAAFFGLTPAEAEGLDPQTRLLMEVLHETSEDAAVAPRLRGSATGTFVGRCFGDYDQAMTAAGRRMGAHDVTGTSVTMAANRAAYHFDLTGPSLVVDTACSSSLYALHLAVEAVRRGECDMAFAAGTNLILDPQHYVRSSALGALSPSGRCHTFDARADGYVPAEAVVAVLVKPLDRALADGDPVHAVIRAVGVNHGGRAGSVTAPNPARQTQLLLDTWAQAGVDPAHIGYLEAHGTGTALGDPVEIEGAVAAFRRHTTASAFCAVGSAKAHLGHAEGAAGLVGLVKAVLQTRHGVIPAMPDYSRPSPHIPLDGSPLHIPTRLLDWETPAGRRRVAGVSSFGFGGSYAHAVVEQAPGRPASAAADEPRLFPFSARDHRSLRQLVRRHRDFLAGTPRTPLDGLAATLHHGREPMPHRVALVAASADGLLSAMDEYLADQDTLNAVYVAAADRAVGPRLREAARIWAGGGAVPDDVSPGPGTPRIHLPVHPFAGSRHWFADTDAPSGTAVPQEASRGTEEPAVPDAGTGAAEAPEVSEVRRHVLASGFSGRHAGLGLDRLDDLLRRWCVRLLGEGGSPLTAERLRGMLQDEDRYGRLADALAAMSATLPGPVGPADFPAEMAALRAEHPELGPWLDLVTVCLPRLPDILAGRADALEVFFSPDHPDLLLHIYDGNTVADHHNEIVARLVAARVRNLRESRPDEPVRLLEIGGGTGGTTRRLLEAVAEYGPGVSYQFTDVSPAFLPAARARFAGTPVAFSCAVLDLDRDPVEQGFAPGSVDIVVAANSVHASRHLGESLARVRRLLAPAGVLVLEELVRNHDCMAAMIGPLPGYWSATDAGVRLPHSPFFDVPRWRAALAEQGFECTWALGAPDLAEDEFDNAVLYSQVPSTVPARRMPTPVSSPVPVPEVSSAPAVPAPVTPPNADADEIRERLRPVFASFFGREPGEVDTATPFDRYGMDSLSAIQLVRSLEPEFGRLPKVLLYEHTSIDSLAAHLAVHAPVPSNIAPAPAAPEPSTVPRSATPRRTWTKDEAPEDPVAIVGMAGRFARSPDLRTWWRRLRDGEHLVGEIPADRFDWREVFGDPHRTPGTVNSRWGSFIDGVDEFDADFFGMTPLEAELMDPQQRLMLQTAWHAVEDAGHRPADLRGSRTGVFVGATSHDYDWQLQRAGRHREGHVVSGNGHCLIANRVSYQMDLRGPSEAVDTACSSSLTALHRAARAVRAGECEAALVGGVHLFLTADLFVALGQLGIVSPDGRCAAFDRRANGMVRGEASVAVLVKPLSRALADGDTVYALVRGSGVSHGGGGHMDSLMMPNPTAQADLIASVYRDAGVDPRTVTYVEAHGTGTEVGDPIEVRGLRKAFASLDGRTDAEEVEPWCLLGTVKSNVGHTEAAAGLTGVVKTVLAMRHAMVPPTLHFTEPNPLLDLDGSPFRVADRLTPWPAHDGPRRAGVSAFGLGGTNAHVLLEDFPETRPSAVPAAGGSPFVVPLSARTPERLHAQIGALYAALTGPGPLPALADIAHTLAVGRDEMARRAAFTVTTTEELVTVLRRTLDGEPDPRAITGDANDASATVHDANSPSDAAEAARRWTAGTAPLLPGPGRRVSLPGYAFEAQRHWAEPLEPDRSAPAPVPSAGDSLPELLQALNEGRLTVDQAEQLMEGVR